MVCLNPCCSGLWSRTDDEALEDTILEVLILVVVDYGLVRDDIAFMAMATDVLILVVVDYGLVRIQQSIQRQESFPS